MKKNFEVLLIPRLGFLLVVAYAIHANSSIAQTNWTWQNPSPQGNWLLGAEVIDASNAVGVGALGTVVKTTNGGSGWTSQNYAAGTANNLQDVSFIDPNTGIAVGINGTITRSVDGGYTWSLQNSGTTNSLLGVDFIDIDRATAVGYSGTVLRSTDGGYTWSLQVSVTDKILRDVSYANIDLGLIVGGSSITGGVILRTTNGGTVWTEVSIGTTAWLTGVQFIDASTAVAVGSGGTILRSTDGGVSWTAQTSGTSEDLGGVSFSSSDVGITHSAANLYRTTNAGASWTLVTLSATGDLSDVSLHSSGRGLVVGEFGTIYRTANYGATWVQASNGSTAQVNKVSYSTLVNGVGAADQRVFHTPDGGSTWTSTSLTGLLYDVSFADPLVGTIVGSSGISGLSWRTTDGGFTWTSGALSSSPLTGIFYVNATVGSIVGNNGTILRTTNGGASWMTQESGTTSNLGGIFLIDTDNAVAVGGTGVPSSTTILRTTNAGQTWEPQVSPTNQFLFSVSFGSPMVGIAVGSLGTIIRTTDGGISWATQSSGTTYTLYSVSMKSDGVSGVVVGNFGTILRTTDAGITWTSEQSGTTTALHGVSSFSGLGFTVVGTSGTILFSPFGNSPLPEVTVDVSIDSLHTFVPAVGDTFTYQMTLTNQTIVQQTVDLWTKVLRPGGNPPIDLYGPETIVLAPSQTFTIDTAQLPVPYNAIEGEYSLVAFVGTYATDTLDTDTTTFVKLPQIPCDSIDLFQAKCKRGGTIQARIVLLNSTEYEGDQVIMRIDGVNHLLTIVTNGTHSRAQIQLTGQPLGEHIISLVSPAGCFDPITVNCSNNLAREEEWLWDNESDWTTQPETLAKETPTEFALYSNYPNPFNPTTTIRYDLPEDSRVTLKVYDVLGREVLTLVDEVESAGRHQVILSATDLSSGVYFYRLKAGEFVQARTLMLIR